MRRTPLLALLVALLWLPLRADAEGYEETELRLKSAGIDDEMRAEIHTAIRRGVARLRAMQWKRGNVPGPAGQTVLAGLALRHAAIPEGVVGATLAIEWVRKYASKEVRERTYEGGLMNMLLDAARIHPKYARAIHQQLSKGPTRGFGYWDYGKGQGPANLSTAQFGCLGLWAGERMGAPVATQAWGLHLQALLEAQADDGSWAYRAAADPDEDARRSRGHTYTTGTFMGLADLLLARQARIEELRAEPERLAQVDVALAKAQAALRRHAQWVLTLPGLTDRIGRFPFYRLYALEKACVFASLEDLGGIAWYREGARWLLDAQMKDGGWATMTTTTGLRRGVPQQSESQSTSFALLFLLRASAAYHPVTPRPVDTPRAPVTSTGGEVDGPAPPAPQTAPPLDAAQAALTTLEEGLGSKRIHQLARYRNALRLIERTYAASLQDGVFASRGHDLWARHAEEVLLQVALRFLRAKTDDRLLWTALAFDALRSLGATHRRAGLPLMKRILDRESSAAFRAAIQAGWYGAAMEALRRLDPPALEVWLGAKALSPEPEDWPRSSAALTALGGLAGTLSGTQRYLAARTVFMRMLPHLRSGGTGLEAFPLTRDIQVALARLARGGEDRQELTEAARPGVGKELIAWWHRHDEPGDPLWQD